MSLSLQTVVLLPPRDGCHLVARNGGSVEPRDSELGCPILHGLEWAVAAEGEESRSFFSFLFFIRMAVPSPFRNFSFSSS